ncbi:hypothetical protein C8J57DRAFT_305863 [Mycena rebaudengoi]|nr:hypothetical protein C8J57DRAFT_305863 [Mycena rebaudengoi]
MNTLFPKFSLCFIPMCTASVGFRCWAAASTFHPFLSRPASRCGIFSPTATLPRRLCQPSTVIPSPDRDDVKSPHICSPSPPSTSDRWLAAMCHYHPCLSLHRTTYSLIIISHFRRLYFWMHPRYLSSERLPSGPSSEYTPSSGPDSGSFNFALSCVSPGDILSAMNFKLPPLPRNDEKAPGGPR